MIVQNAMRDTTSLATLVCTVQDPPGGAVLILVQHVRQDRLYIMELMIAMSAVRDSIFLRTLVRVVSDLPDDAVLNLVQHVMQD
jgi:hypothetical protein